MTPIQEQILRTALHVPCNSKEELHRWIKIYLGIDLPDCIVCLEDPHHPPSNSSPMDLVWEIYSKAKDGTDPNFQEILAYSARDGYKTVSASIIELLCLIHLRRDVVHLAAIEAQSAICLGYIRKYLGRPILREYTDVVNRRELIFKRYESDDGRIISPIEFKRLKDGQQDHFTEIKHSIKITVATVEACNGLHASFLCVSDDSVLNLKFHGAITAKQLVSEMVSDSDMEKEFVAKIDNSKVRLLSYDQEKKEYFFNKITRLSRKKSKVVQVSLESGSIQNLKEGKTEKTAIKCSPDHLFLVRSKHKNTPGDWIPAEKLLPGMLLEGLFSRNRVTEVNALDKEEWVNDFAIEKVHNFVCNGVVVHNCMDELDIAPPAAFMEAKSIPVSTEDGKYPITFLTSTRKYSYGLVQKEIDKAQSEGTGLQVRHWNYLDVTEACPPSRHLPDEPKINIFVNEESLSAISESDWEKLPESDKPKYEKTEGFKGCLEKCKIYSACRGRLAVNQKSKSPLLKKIPVTQTNIKKVSLEHAKAQYLCWRPSSAGLVFPTFDRALHVVSAAQMANIATGEEYPEGFSKRELIKLFQSMDAKFMSGVDWGFTHNFTVVTAALVGHILYVIDVISAGELDPQEMIDITKKQVGPLKPVMFPDNSYPSMIKAFRKNGFQMVDFQKEVLEGIDAIRARLFGGVGRPPTIWFLGGDVGVEVLLKEMSQYHWKLDKAGNLLDEPDKEGDDAVDSLRYLCQNTQLGKSRFIVNKQQEKSQRAAVAEDFMKNKINELTGESNSAESQAEIQGEEGGMKFIF